MSLWNDVFKIEVTVTKNPYESNSYVEYFDGSLKGAIRFAINKFVLNKKIKGNVVLVFYDSSGCYLKEMGFE